MNYPELVLPKLDGEGPEERVWRVVVVDQDYLQLQIVLLDGERPEATGVDEGRVEWFSELIRNDGQVNIYDVGQRLYTTAEAEVRRREIVHQFVKDYPCS